MAADRTMIADILRVDHAGEYGAIRIYEAQRWAARRRTPDLMDFLTHTLGDERRHLEVFARLMRERGVTPCGALPLWGLGGGLLGLMTGLLGRTAILICTEAVERTVHRHLTDQIAWLQGRDTEVSDAIAAIGIEELEHLQTATGGAGSRRSQPWARALDGVVAAATETLIWLSTYGASRRLARAIRAGRGQG